MLAGLALCRRGVAALEFAVIAPTMAIALTGLIDLGNIAQQRIQLQEAVRAGGSYALSNPSNTAGMTTAIKNAMPAGLSASAAVAAPTYTCVCKSGTGCGGGATICTNGAILEGYITLSVTLPFSPLRSLITSSTVSYVVRYV